MARKRAAAEATEGAATMTKADAVRAAVTDGADTPAEGVAYIKTKFGIDITPQHFSSYKSQQKAKARKAAGRRGRKTGTTIAADAAAQTRSAAGVPNVASSQATIKQLV